MGEITITEKYCPKCKTIKPADQFHRSKSQVSGLVSHCRPCTREKNKARYAAGKLQPPLRPSAKRCGDCSLTKSSDEFLPNHKSKDGLSWQCRECRKTYMHRYSRSARGKATRAAYVQRPEARAGIRESARRSYQSEKGKAWRMAYFKTETYKRANKRHHLRERGLSMEQFSEMLVGQNGVCAICYRPCPSGNNLHVDHDHATGKIRGLLCTPCNTSLGGFQDSIEVLNRAIHYLLSYSDCSMSS